MDLATAQTFAGAIWRPHDARWRLGLEARLPATLESRTVPAVEDGLALPTAGAYSPWEVGIGAVCALNRTLNARPTYGEAPYQPPLIPEGMFSQGLLSADLLLVGGSSHATTISAWASGVLRPVRAEPTLAARVGIESEFWPHRMRGRFGNYWEQSRVKNVPSRFHVTGGIDVHLGRVFWEWRLSAAADVAPSYVNTMFSVGLWH